MRRSVSAAMARPAPGGADAMVRGSIRVMERRPLPSSTATGDAATLTAPARAGSIHAYGTQAQDLW
ncbi:hypothetical protein FH608_035240 [Nonomuraea phyllanthi]|uniref:Uncharacterized protein n=1 Tax=Nonomuraea phyllanthi TaxID=2219224 RepID=A0A5C4VVL0_9ACTN|nr:hypothetical protein [Nonomuraea phyllanthi]KAB8190235.1 hypothetical protein FH608_035240 [Nonomuraea phyllanthi]